LTAHRHAVARATVGDVTILLWYRMASEPIPAAKSNDHTGGHANVVESACPLDCPDSCTLSITVRQGKLLTLDGGQTNPVTNGYICAKVRRFGERVYGPDRLLHPAVRKGRKGEGRFSRVSWDEALGLIADRVRHTIATSGAEAILPFAYGGSNGMLTHDAADATLWRRLGASRLARTLCAAPTGLANMTLYGKMPSVTYQDYPEAALIVLWGVNPAASGIHLVPYIRQAQKRGAKLIVVDPRATTLSRSADVHLAVRPGTDVAVALAIHRYLFARGFADLGFLETHAVGADRLRERCEDWSIERAAAVADIEAGVLQRAAELYATSSPALIRCGWGLERNRNGGNAAMAVLALPAVGGKFGVRGGGYSMSNSASWNISPTWIGAPETNTRIVNMNKLGRALTELSDPPIKVLFSYNCNPVATVPDQRRIIRGLEREDLFTVVFEQVMTDTAMYADVILPATTFLESYEFAKAYGPMSLQLGRPAIEPVGESRPNADVFAELARRLEVVEADDPSDELELLVKIIDGLPPEIASQLREGAAVVPRCGIAPVQFVDVFPRTPDKKIQLFDDTLDASSPEGLYRFQPDPASTRYPLALISPSSDRTISSTLGELPRPDVVLSMHPDDAAARGLEARDLVRIFNELGEVQCPLAVSTVVPRGVVSLPKGIWRRSTKTGFTGTALVPDTLTDLGGGACFNDARVQVASVASA
jgi:anaerobic selenocysteine-containing dehydrogenase